MPKSVSDIVEELISSNPCISYLIGEGIVNYSSLAKLLQPAVNDLSNSEVRVNTIVQSLRRAASKSRFEDYSSVAKALAEADYNIYQNVNEFTFGRQDIPRLLSKLAEPNILESSVLILFLSGDSLTLVVDDKTANRLNIKQSATKYTLLKISIRHATEARPGSSAFLA
ncbi:MAG: hypothetical protein QXR69_04125, partial [Conexivisphaerales archaeon]